MWWNNLYTFESSATDHGVHIMIGLVDFLYARGWAHDIAFEAWNEYIKAGANAAAQTVAWGNDTEHDYSGELEDDIVDWEVEVDKESLPQIKTFKK